jgi:hypothetical protein
VSLWLTHGSGDVFCGVWTTSQQQQLCYANPTFAKTQQIFAPFSDVYIQFSILIGLSVSLNFESMAVALLTAKFIAEFILLGYDVKHNCNLRTRNFAPMKSYGDLL